MCWHRLAAISISNLARLQGMQQKKKREMSWFWKKWIYERHFQERAVFFKNDRELNDMESHQLACWRVMLITTKAFFMSSITCINAQNTPTCAHTHTRILNLTDSIILSLSDFLIQTETNNHAYLCALLCVCVVSASREGGWGWVFVVEGEWKAIKTLWVASVHG